MKIGLIGCGRMGGALIEGAIGASITTPEEVWLHSRSEESARALAKKTGAHVATSNSHVASECDLVILGVKPYQVTEILEEISDVLPGNCVLVSVAAGITLAKMEAACPEGSRIIRAMPNTPSLIGLGAAGMAAGAHATASDLVMGRQMLEAVGIVSEVAEADLDAVTGLSGSGPAYIYTLIDALIAQAQKEGLPASEALRLATQTVVGAARMVEQTDMTPRELVNQVTSPGGTTLAGLAALTEHGFESSIAAGVAAATERSREIARE